MVDRRWNIGEKFFKELLWSRDLMDSSKVGLRGKRVTVKKEEEHIPG